MPDYGYDVHEPYVCMDSAHSDENRIVFVSNGDGTGELYAAGSTGLPILTQQLGGIRPADKPGLYIAYDTDGNAEEPSDARTAYMAIVNGFGQDGVIVYQALKIMRTSDPSIYHAVGVHELADGRWQTIEYGIVDDGFGGKVDDFNNAYPRQILISSTKPDYGIRVLKYETIANMRHVLVAK